MRRPPLLALGTLLASSFVLGACGVFDGDEAEPFTELPYVLDCNLYCSVMLRRCQGAAVQFASPDACAEACAGYPADGNVYATSGNSLQCRFNLLMVMRPPTMQVFCRAAGPSGGTLCQ